LGPDDKDTLKPGASGKLRGMSEITHILNAIEAGDAHAVRELLPLVYDELRRLAAAQLAREEPGQTLDATALVHEAYLRLAGKTSFAGKSHFFRAAAEAMRRILVDQARKKRAEKRGGGAPPFALSEADRGVMPDLDTLLTVDEALTKLAAEEPASAEVARLRLFAGLSIEEAAEAFGISRATAFRDWAYARAVLTAALTGEEKSRRETPSRRRTLERLHPSKAARHSQPPSGGLPA
jgi:RNA polymerase sigma factor (TIGR02999 family)